MKNTTIKYIDDWKQSPMAFWVHVEIDSKPWYNSEKFNPPAPIQIGAKGYLQLTIEFNGFSFLFTSEEQLNEFIEIMERKLLPSTIELSAKRGATKGPNSHWLSRLPGKTKPWKYREKLVKYCKKIEFPNR